MTRPQRIALAVACALGVTVSAQQSGPAGLRSSLDRLEQALRQKDMAPLLPVLDPGFRVAGFTGDMARSIISQVVAAGRIVPDAIEVESVSAVGDHFKVVAVFTLPAGARAYDLLVSKDARFIEINVMQVETTSETRMVGGAAPANPALRAELLEMLETDQRHRGELSTLMQDRATADTERIQRLQIAQAALDEANVRKLVAILEDTGWPTAAAVGADAGRAAFLVLQHAPIEVQERYLPTARGAAAAGELERSSLALLEDRVLMARGRNQIYGTQLRMDPELELWPIDDEANVDARRKAVGLEPLADYLRRFGLTYTPRIT